MRHGAQQWYAWITVHEPVAGPLLRQNHVTARDKCTTLGCWWIDEFTVHICHQSCAVASGISNGNIFVCDLWWLVRSGHQHLMLIKLLHIHTSRHRCLLFASIFCGIAGTVLTHDAFNFNQLLNNTKRTSRMVPFRHWIVRIKFIKIRL